MTEIPKFEVIKQMKNYRLYILLFFIMNYSNVYFAELKPMTFKGTNFLIYSSKKSNKNEQLISLERIIKNSTQWTKYK